MCIRLFFSRGCCIALRTGRRVPFGCRPSVAEGFSPTASVWRQQAARRAEALGLHYKALRAGDVSYETLYHTPFRSRQQPAASSCAILAARRLAMFVSSVDQHKELDH